jgi:predicted RNase H-like HicB family nuclease
MKWIIILNYIQILEIFHMSICYTAGMKVEFDREVDGRWIADIPEIPGAMAYGRTKKEAELKACSIARSAISFMRDEVARK